MNKTFMKTGVTLTAICMCGLLLAGCGGKTANDSSSAVNGSNASTSVDIPDNQTPTAVVTDVALSDAEVHEVIAPQTFTEGEVIDNPYYKRTSDENGTPVFAVIQAASGQVAYLPFSETTVYHMDEGPCYFERKVLTYKLDGVDKTTTQYDLWVTDVLPEDNAADTDTQMEAGASSADNTLPDLNVEVGGAPAETDN